MSGEEVSRRALLGAAVGLPLLPRHPELVSGSSSLPHERAASWTLKQVQGDGRGDGGWVEALAAFHAVEGELRALERATAGQSAEDEEALQEVYDARVDAFGGAVRGVMLAAAPDFVAFAAKLELFFGHALEPHSVDEDILRAIQADAQRLSGLV